MGQNQFTESLVEIMLSWMRWLTSWFWNIVNSDGTGGGFLTWFGNNWKSLTVFLIVAGVIVDWLVWMIRWRPYWLWLRKRQVIYEEVPVHKKKSRSEEEEDEFAEYEAHEAEADEEYAEDEYFEDDDPNDDFTDEEYASDESESDEAASDVSDSDEAASDEEYSAEEEAAQMLSADASDDDLSEWDSFDDPYAQPEQQDTPEYSAPAETPKKVHLNHSRPVLGERMNFSDVDDGQ